MRIFREGSALAMPDLQELGLDQTYSQFPLPG
jgi:hypothetical protein